MPAPPPRPVPAPIHDATIDGRWCPRCGGETRFLRKITFGLKNEPTHIATYLVCCWPDCDWHQFAGIREPYGKQDG